MTPIRPTHQGVRRRLRHRATALVGAGVIGALLLAGCGGDDGGSKSGSTPSTKTQPSTPNTAPRSARVDLARPRFSNPTAITNPRFPISELTQVIQLGTEAGDRIRFEVTTLEETKVVEWKGQSVETVQSQFVGYTNGRVAEVAVDFFAQADDGAVWYFGEDVDNYRDGTLANHEGTWLAGKDGPPGMIMPADPKVGDVYRPENIPDFVFEEVTVKEVDQTVDGPRGPVPGAVAVQELLMDGLLEDKIFAPGYGEFRFEVPDEEEVAAVALAVLTDALTGPVPAELTALSTGATQVFELAAGDDPSATSAAVEAVTTSWDAVRAGATPPLLAQEMDDALAALRAAVDANDEAAIRQAAIDVAQATLDLELQYRPAAEVDQARVEVWERQLTLDEADGDEAEVAGDRVILATISARIPG